MSYRSFNSTTSYPFRPEVPSYNSRNADMIWRFSKMVGFPNNQLGFLLQIIILGCEIGGNHHLRKHPYLPFGFNINRHPPNSGASPAFPPAARRSFPRNCPQGFEVKNRGQIHHQKGENRGGWKKFHRNIFHRKNKTKRVVALRVSFGYKNWGSFVVNHERWSFPLWQLDSNLSKRWEYFGTT